MWRHTLCFWNDITHFFHSVRSRTCAWVAVITLQTAFSLTAHAASVSLAWNGNTEPDIAGYRVYYGVASHTYFFPPVDVGNLTTATLPNLAAGTTYYFAATAYNTAGAESAFSNEVVFSHVRADSTPSPTATRTPTPSPTRTPTPSPTGKPTANPHAHAYRFNSDSNA